MFRCKIKTLCRMLVAAVSLLAVLACLDLKAEADEYPNRVVQLIVPYPPGGGVDTEGRVIAQKLSEALAQRVIVVNKPGGGSVIGVRDAAKATPDGYTILMLVTGASLPANPGYDLQKDLTPIGLGASIPIVVMGHTSRPRQRQHRYAALADAQLLRRRAVQIIDWRRCGGRHLQGHRSANDRSLGRAYQARLQHAPAGHRQHQGRRDQGYCGRCPAAARRHPRRADDRGVGRAARYRAVLWARRAGGDASADHRSPKQGIARGARR